MIVKNSVGLLNGKGGTFKSSITAGLATQAWLKDKKVLVFDLDAQQHQALLLGFEDDLGEGERLLEFLIDSDSDSPIFESVGGKEGLDLLTGGPLFDDHHLKEEGWTPASPYELGERLEAITKGYDIVFFDFPPGIGQLFVQQGINAVNTLLTPTTKSPLDNDGIDHLQTELKLSSNRVVTQPDGYVYIVDYKNRKSEIEAINEYLKDVEDPHMGTLYFLRDLATECYSKNKTFSELFSGGQKLKGASKSIQKKQFRMYENLFEEVYRRVNTNSNLKYRVPSDE